MNNNPRTIDLIDRTRPFDDDSSPGIAGHGFFHTGTHKWGLGTDQRHGLTLHIRAHQGAVGVIVFKERYQRRRNRHQLFWRHINEVNFIGRHHQHVTGLPASDEIVLKLTGFVEHLIGLGDGIVAFIHGGQINNISGHLTFIYFPVWAFDKAVLVDPGVGCQTVDQANVRPFRCFNGTNSAIVGRMHVTHFKTGALTG